MFLHKHFCGLDLSGFLKIIVRRRFTCYVFQMEVIVQASRKGVYPWFVFQLPLDVVLLTYCLLSSININRPCVFDQLEHVVSFKSFLLKGTIHVSRNVFVPFISIAIFLNLVLLKSYGRILPSRGSSSHMLETPLLSP